MEWLIEFSKLIIINIGIGMLYILISLHNAILVELYTAVRAILTAVYWMGSGFTVEFVIEDEDGNIIHHFPQLNFPNKF